MLQNYKALADNLLKLFDKFEIEATSRSPNQFTNATTSIVSLIPKVPKRSTLVVEIVQLSQSSLDSTLKEFEVMTIDVGDKDVWYTKLVNFLKMGIIP